MWQGKRVFLTGHTGFKGSWMAEWFLALGARVSGFALAPDTAGIPQGDQSLFDELGLAARLDHRIGDIRDQAALAGALAECDPEVVVHMAAQPLVRDSYVTPVETYATNVMGTVHLLNACRALPRLRAVLIVTSDKCYENQEQIWGYRESDAFGGHDPYSSSKGCAEIATASFRRSFFPPDRMAEHGVALCSARAGNVIGGGDWSRDRLIPDAMRAMRAGEPVLIRNPQAVRPWQHVLEPLGGYMRLLEVALTDPAAAVGGWNFGPDLSETRSVAQVMSDLGHSLEGRLEVQMAPDGAAPHEAQLLALDCTLAQHRLNWRPKLSSAETIDWTAAWYKAQTPQARRQIVLDQLGGYRARAAG